MVKATVIRTVKVNGVWFVTAYLNDLPYQERFENKPTDTDVKNATGRFEVNYEGLNESTRKPITVTPHHSDCD